MTRVEQGSGLPEQPAFQTRHLIRRDMREMLRVASESTGDFWTDEDMYQIVRAHPDPIGIEVPTDDPFAGLLVGLVIYPTPWREPVLHAFGDEEKSRVVYPELDENGYLEIQLLAISPDWRTKGAGEKLRDWVWDKVRKFAQGMYLLVPATSEALPQQTFFRSLGFLVPADNETHRPVTVWKDGKEYYKMVYSGAKN